MFLPIRTVRRWTDRPELEDARAFEAKMRQYLTPAELTRRQEILERVEYLSAPPRCNTRANDVMVSVATGRWRETGAMWRIYKQCRQSPPG